MTPGPDPFSECFPLSAEEAGERENTAALYPFWAGPEVLFLLEPIGVPVPDSVGVLHASRVSSASVG